MKKEIYVQWEHELAVCSDEELLEAYHQNTRAGAFTSSHHTYMSLLMHELARRPFDSSIILSKDRNGEPLSLKFKCRVKLDKQNMKLVLENSEAAQ